MTTQDSANILQSSGLPIRLASGENRSQQAEQSPATILWRNRGLLLASLDAVAVASCFILAYYIRFYAQFLAIKQVPVAAVGSYLNGAALLAIMWVFLIWRDGGYESGLRGVGAPMIRIHSLLSCAVYAVLTLMAISFIWRDLLLSRQVYIMTGVFAFGMTALLRLLFGAVDRDLGEQGVVVQRVLVAGMSEQAAKFADRLDADGGTIKIIGFLDWDPCVPSKAFAGRPVFGAFADISSIYLDAPFDTLALAPSDGVNEGTRLDQKGIMEVINFCEKKGISLYMLLESFDVAVTRHEVASLSGAPFIRLQDAFLHPIYGAIKRVMDIVLAGAGILLGMPIWLAIALVIKLTSKGPALYTQTRAGLHGKPFRMYKFRSMVADAEERLAEIIDMETLDEPVFKIKNDPRVTTVGAFLRRASLDEAPQFLNVLKGEMSLVGPRPEEMRVVEKYDHWQRRRLKAKPGITGLQQIRNRGENSLAERVKHDLIYLKHQSLALDLYILLKTIVVVFRGSGVTH